MCCFFAAPQSVALPIKFSAGRIAKARLRRAAQVCVSQDGRLGSRLQLGGSQRQPLLDDYGLAAGVAVAVAVAGGRTLGLGMGPDGIGGAVGGACNFASRNFFRCCAS
jgi:hypothetical protein